MSYRLKLHLHGAEVREIELEPGREYVFGRGSNCDVVLEGQDGISRNHFRVAETDGVWTVSVTSKFGDLLHRGQPVSTLHLEPGTTFKLAGYDFHFLESATTDSESPAIADSRNLPIAIGQSGSFAMNAPVPESFEGNDETTRIVPVVVGLLPHVRIIEPGGPEETIKLEGHKWIAGREDGCGIQLNDRKASRRQFELTSSAQGYFIRDLASSNGTLLNGSLLAADELKPLRSGDVITVGALTIHFEVRDPNFEKKLMVVPPEVLSAVPAIAQNPYEMIQYPFPSGPTPSGSGGAVRLDGYVDPSSVADAKKKKIRLYLIIAAVALVLIGLFSGGGNGPNSKSQDAATVDPFTRLSPQKQQMVKETFVLARNLYTQGKLELAAGQLKKLHEILPEGYQSSLAMAEDCRASAENAERLRFIEEERKKQEENRRIVEKNLKDCQRVAVTSTSIEALRSCLAPALERDPEHPALNEMIARAQARLDQLKMRQNEQREYQERVNKGRSLYRKAESLEEQGNVFGAMETYKKHIDSSYPDPDRLKAKSQKNLASLTRKISVKIEESLSAAQAAYSAQNLREALEHIKAAKNLDSQNTKAIELNAKIRRELTLKLKEIYEESVIAEGLGQLDKAKDLWKKIVETDHPEGEYYKKARNKLRIYGSM